MDATHIILWDDQTKGDYLFRKEDGMLLGARLGSMVRFGEDPQNQQMRHFIDQESADRFLRKHVAPRVPGEVCIFDERGGKNLISVPAGGTIKKVGLAH